MPAGGGIQSKQTTSDERMKLSLLALVLVATVVCISVIDSAPAPHWPRFRERRLRNRPDDTKKEEGGKEEKKESAPEGETKKEEKSAQEEAKFDFGTLPVQEAAAETKKEAPKKAAQVEEEEEEEEEGLSIEA